MSSLLNSVSHWEKVRSIPKIDFSSTTAQRTPVQATIECIIRLNCAWLSCTENEKKLSSLFCYSYKSTFPAVSISHVRANEIKREQQTVFGRAEWSLESSSFLFVSYEGRGFYGRSSRRSHHTGCYGLLGRRKMTNCSNDDFRPLEGTLLVFCVCSRARAMAIDDDGDLK